MDGTHVSCIPPFQYAERYRNRHATLSYNVLAVVSFDMQFTYIMSGVEVPINIIDPSLPTEDIPRISTIENADNHEVSVGNRSRTTADLNAFRDQLTWQMWHSYQQQLWYR